MKTIHYRIAGAAAIILAIALGIITYTTTDAHGATPGAGSDGPCTIPAEFNQLHDGMTKTQVQSILDGRGRPSTVRPNDLFYQRNYPVCGRPYNKARVYVMYRHHTGRLYASLWFEVDRGTLDRR
jgi:hypothetical protein